VGADLALVATTQPSSILGARPDADPGPDRAPGEMLAVGGFGSGCGHGEGGTLQKEMLFELKYPD